MTYGYKDLAFDGLINCMLDNKCLRQYPEDGPCVGADEDAVKNVKKMEDIEGKQIIILNGSKSYLRWSNFVGLWSTPNPKS